jgi:biotin carboxyl carrier protein
MQNAVRSPKSGTVERVLVAEGQAVNAGEVLAVIA